MTTRTDQLWAPTDAPTTAGVVLFTCPAGATAIVKRVTNANASATSATIIYGIGGFVANQRLWGPVTIAVNGFQEIDTWWVLLPGQTLVGRTSTAATVTTAGFGTILEGVNPL